MPNSRQKVLGKLKNKRYRDAFVREKVRTGIPNQVFILRKQAGKTQGELAKLAKTTQTVISRVEDPNYGKLTLSSLVKLANGLDIGLLVKFVPFSKLLDEVEDVSAPALAADNFDVELDALEDWAESEPAADAAVGSISNKLTKGERNQVDDIAEWKGKKHEEQQQPSMKTAMGGGRQ